MNYILGVDVWEGNPQIDELTLKTAGVEFMVIRLNDMNGGHHKDVNFDAQWAQAANFIRWPYFVYNPWVSGQQNFDWLATNTPAGAHAVSFDIEVRKTGYSPHEYATQTSIFRALVAQYWHHNTYTGTWFLDCLDSWPVTDYWWARYPYVVYPAQREHWTWNQLKAVMDSMTWNPGTPPGPCKLWQITGDRLIMPGCGDTCVDINAWNGTLEELRMFAGCAPERDSWKWDVTNGLRALGQTVRDPE